MATRRFQLSLVKLGSCVMARMRAASFLVTCLRGAACLLPNPFMVLALAALSATALSAQSAHLKQAQIYLSAPGQLNSPQGIAVDKSGDLYVADADNKRVLKLTPSDGGYSQSTVGTGLNSPYGVAVDAGGNVYIADQSLATLLKETPDGSGGYTQSAIGSGLIGALSVAVDLSGNIYAVEVNSASVGTLVKETLAGGSYTQSIIPAGGSQGVAQVAVDSHGNLFLDDSADGTTIEEVLTGGNYVPTTLANRSGPLSVDSNNNLYISDTYYGIAKFSPDEDGIEQSNIYIPTDGNLNYTRNLDNTALAVDASGNLFLNDLFGNALLEITTTQTNFGALNVGNPSYPMSLFFEFDTTSTLGSEAVVTQGVASKEFMDPGTGSCVASTSYTPGEYCIVYAKFTPAAPGLRTAAAELLDGTGSPLATVFVQGTGVAPQANFSGAPLATYIPGFSIPFGLAIDASGNIYVANAGAGNVMVTAPGGSPTPIGSGFTSPSGVAVDGAGNVFVADSGSVYEISKATGAQTTLSIPGLTDPYGLAVDGAGNLYISESTASKVIEVTPAGVVTQVGTGLSSPRGLAVDAAGTVYVADYAEGGVIIIPVNGAQTGVYGFGGPTGVAVDPAGNIYVAVFGAGDLTEVAPDGTRTVLGSNLPDPADVVLDAAGNIYVAEYIAGAVQKIDRSDAPSLTFASTIEGLVSSDSPQLVGLENNGNATLHLPGLPSVTNPSVSSNFSLENSGATTCMVTAANASEPATLAAGASCMFAVSFQPTTTGGLSGDLTLVDDSNNAAAPTYVSQSISLSGTGTPQTSQIAVLSSPSLSSPLGSSATFQWSAGTGVFAYELRIGTTGPGSQNVYNSGSTMATFANVSGLPTNGVALYVTLYSEINVGWRGNNYVYTESGTPTPATLSTPTPGAGSILGTSSVSFQWNPGAGPSEYQLWLGTTGPGSKDIYNSGGTYATAVVVPSIPSGGITVYARLYSEINSAWQFNDYTYTESGTPAPAALTSPSPGIATILGTTSVGFQWNPGSGLTEYQLWLGTTGVGSKNLYNSGGTFATSVIVPSIPAGGVTVYARLYSEIGSTWQYHDYTYTEFGAPSLATLSSPSPGIGTILGTSNVTFQWSTGAGPTEYQLWLGTTGPGSKNLYNSGGTYSTTATVPSIPAVGATVYVRLYSEINSVWQYNDYVYTEQ